MTGEKERTNALKGIGGELFSSFGIKMEKYGEGKKLLLISGAKSVLHYSPTFLELDIGSEFLILEGSSILCRTFLSGAVEVIGRIDSLRLSDRYVKAEETVPCG